MACSEPLRWQVLSLLLQREGYEELAEKCIFVAGHKASTCNISKHSPEKRYHLHGTLWNPEPAAMWDFRIRWRRCMWLLLQFKSRDPPSPGVFVQAAFAGHHWSLSHTIQPPGRDLRNATKSWIDICGACVHLLVLQVAPNSQHQITRACCTLMILDLLAILSYLFCRTPRIKLVMPTLVHFQSEVVVKAVLR